MFLVSLSYKAPIEEIERALPDHVRFLERCYADKCFLMSGPKKPRTGGVILAVAETEETLWQILKQDPFWRLELADYEVTEWLPNRSAEALEGLLPSLES
mgnify:CR=1 FL=1